MPTYGSPIQMNGNAINGLPSATYGVSLSNGDRVLLKNQSDATQNGIRVFTSAGAALVRSADASTAAELSGIAVNVLAGGTVNGGTSWIQPSKITTLGSDTITFTSFGGVPDATESTKGKAEIATQAETDGGVDDTRIVTPAKLAASVWAAKRYEADIGDGVNDQIDVTHNLGSLAVNVEVWVNSSGKDFLVDVTRLNTNTIRLNFGVAPTANELHVFISR